MSTPTPARDATRTAVVPRPRRSVEPPATAPEPEPARTADEPVGVFGRHPWLIPATGIAMVFATFLSMVLLTWAAGGPTPWDR